VKKRSQAPKKKNEITNINMMMDSNQRIETIKSQERLNKYNSGNASYRGKNLIDAFKKN